MSSIKKVFAEKLSDYMLGLSKRKVFCPHCEGLLSATDEIPVMILENNLARFGSKLGVKYGLLEFSCPECEKEVKFRDYSDYFKELIINENMENDDQTIAISPEALNPLEKLAKLLGVSSSEIDTDNISRIHFDFFDEEEVFEIIAVTKDKEKYNIFSSSSREKAIQFASNLIYSINKDDSRVVYLGSFLPQKAS
jgi:hypothetical protein